jgi:hypothetical protein
MYSKNPQISYFEVYYSHMTLPSGNNVLGIHTLYFPLWVQAWRGTETSSGLAFQSSCGNEVGF